MNLSFRSMNLGFGKHERARPWINVAGGIYPLAQASAAGVVGESSIRLYTNRSSETITSIEIDYSNYRLTGTNEISAASLGPIDVESAAIVGGVYFNGSEKGTGNTRLNIAPNGHATYAINGFEWVSGGTLGVQTDVQGTAGTWSYGQLGAPTLPTSNRLSQRWTSAPQWLARSGIAPTGSSQPCYECSAIRAQTAKAFCVGVLGDSWVQGAGDGNNEADRMTGFVPAAFGRLGSYPYLPIGYTGTKLVDNYQAAGLANRLAIVANACTHVVIEWGINDVVAAGQSLGAMQTQYTALATLLKAQGVFVAGQTIGPRTTSTDSWATVANQTVASLIADSGGTSGSASQIINEFNDWLRTVPVPLDDVVEVADTVMSAHNSQIWNVGDGTWTNPAYTSDGIHPRIDSLSTNRGAVYLVAQALLDKATVWHG